MFDEYGFMDEVYSLKIEYLLNTMVMDITKDKVVLNISVVPFLNNLLISHKLISKKL